MTYKRLLEALLKRKEFLQEEIGECYVIFTQPNNTHRVRLAACTKKYQCEERLKELQWVIDLVSTKLASAASAEVIRSKIQEILEDEVESGDPDLSNPYPPEEGGDKDDS